MEDILTDKDKYTYVTVKWSTYDNMLEIPHVEHFNVNLTPKEFIDRVATYYEDEENVPRLYFDRYTSMELTDRFRKQLMMKYGIHEDHKWTFDIELQEGQDQRIETLVY